MMETFGAVVLWLIGGALLIGGGAMWIVDGEASRVGGVPRSRFPKIIVALGAALLVLLLLSGCMGKPSVVATPNSCVTLIPENWRAGVPGVSLPSNDTIGEWIAFGDGQTGKLEQANGRTRDSIEIVERCENRDREAVRKATRGWLGRLFGS